jgi:hypothetical protein
MNKECAAAGEIGVGHPSASRRLGQGGKGQGEKGREGRDTVHRECVRGRSLRESEKRSLNEFVVFCWSVACMHACARGAAVRRQAIL